MRNYNAANPNGPGVESLPHYAEREAIHERMRNSKPHRGDRIKLTERTRCVWPECDRRRIKYEKDWRDRWPDVDLSTFPLCAHHAWQAHQTGYEMGMVPSDENDNPVYYIGRKHDRRPAKVGAIYYLRVGEVIKIGFASNLASRLAHYPPNAEFILAHAGTLGDERDIHGKLLASRSHGKEWYKDCAEVRDLIEVQRAAHEPLKDPRPKPRGSVVKPRSNFGMPIR